MNMNSFTIMTDGIGSFVFILKTLNGLKYLKAVLFATKIDFDHLYQADEGVKRWRIKRVKVMRKALAEYFYSSANALTLYSFI